MNCVGCNLGKFGRIAFVVMIIAFITFATVGVASAAEVAGPPDANGDYGHCREGTSSLLWSGGSGVPYESWVVCQVSSTYWDLPTFPVITVGFGTMNRDPGNTSRTALGASGTCVKSTRRGKCVLKVAGNRASANGWTTFVESTYEHQCAITCVPGQGTMVISGTSRTARYSYAGVSPQQPRYSDTYFPGGTPGNGPCAAVYFNGPDLTTDYAVGTVLNFTVDIEDTPLPRSARVELIEGQAPDPVIVTDEPIPEDITVQKVVSVEVQQANSPHRNANWVCSYTDEFGQLQTYRGGYSPAGALPESQAVNRDGATFDLSACLSGAGIGIEPSSWVPGLVKSTGCLLRWAFIPDENPFEETAVAFEDSFVSSMFYPFERLNSAWLSFDGGYSGAASVGCKGPELVLPLGNSGNTFDFTPLSTCEAPVTGVADITRKFLTVVTYVGTAFGVARILTSAFGMEMAVGGSRSDN